MSVDGIKPGSQIERQRDRPADRQTDGRAGRFTHKLQGKKQRDMAAKSVAMGIQSKQWALGKIQPNNRFH